MYGLSINPHIRRINTWYPKKTSPCACGCHDGVQGRSDDARAAFRN